MPYSSPESARIELKKNSELRGHLMSALRGSLLDPNLHDTAYQMACYLGLTGFFDRCTYGNIFKPLGQKNITSREAITLAFRELREHKVLPETGFFGNIRQRRAWGLFMSHLVWSILYIDGEGSP